MDETPPHHGLLMKQATLHTLPELPKRPEGSFLFPLLGTSDAQEERRRRGRRRKESRGDRVAEKMTKDLERQQ